MCIGEAGTRSSFRTLGFFQRNDPGGSAARVGSDPPNSQGCTPESVEAKAGRAKHPESGYGSDLVMCVADEKKGQSWTPGRPLYAGGYELLDGDRPATVNPVTGSASCSAGTTPVMVARVRKDGGGGAQIYLCRTGG
jgi:hypothetical protein